MGAIGRTTDPFLDISMGANQGVSGVNKFGANSLVAKDTIEDVWDGGGDYPYPATALITSMSQKVDQVAMRAATIEIQGLDANWDLVIQMVNLDAADTTTPVTLTTALIRVFRVNVNADVVGDSNITVHNVGNTVDYAIVTAGNNQTLMASYTVPNNYTAYGVSYYATVVEATGKEPKSTRFDVWFAGRGNNYEFQLKHAIGIPKAGSMATHEFAPYIIIKEKTDIKITASPIGEDADVAAGFDLILVKNP